MYRKFKSASVASVCFLLLLYPVLTSSTALPVGHPKSASATVTDHKTLFSSSVIKNESHVIYDSLKLETFGLARKAFEYAWLGYQTLLEKGTLKNTDIISICDFSQSSCKKRLYIIDVAEMKVLLNTYVAHGRKSGGEFARYFSNLPKSHKSSLGFYVTESTYYGEHGLSLKIRGLEKGINDRADARNIVIHGSDYVGDRFLEENPFNGRSYGCPAIPALETSKIINTIKDGSCLFIYHPTKLYLAKSKILNG